MNIRALPSKENLERSLKAGAILLYYPDGAKSFFITYTYNVLLKLGYSWDDAYYDYKKMEIVEMSEDKKIMWCDLKVK